MPRARLTREAYLALKKFKREINSQRAGKIFKDHLGHLYKVDGHGTIRRLSRDELGPGILNAIGREQEHMFGKINHTDD